MLDPGFPRGARNYWKSAYFTEITADTITFGALAPYTADSVYVNYLADEDTARVQAAYGPCWDRLQQVKRTYDPEDVFHLSQNVAPA